MKLNDKAIAALQQPDTKTIAFDMTPERKAKIKLVSDKIVDLLKAHTAGPLEAYMVLQFVMEGFEQTYDIRGGTILDSRDQKH